tara:strand:- start:1271 stop:2245 length:975 start_codon:yes stop_codon:yes gene_type:complete
VKKFIIPLICFTTLFLSANELVPDKLVKAVDSFKKNPELHPIHKIDLIVFKNLKISERDTEEIFPLLEEFTFSSDLIELSINPSFLVEKESIGKGLTANKEVIKTVNIDNNKAIPGLTDSLDNSLIENKPKKPLKLSFPYFEKTDNKGSQISVLVKKLEAKKEYELLFNSSWYQPMFNKELASPVHIVSRNKKNGVKGELIVYKERFLHSLIKIRLIEKTSDYSKVNQLTTYDFNYLLNLSKVDSKLTSFFNNIGREVSTFSSWLFRTKDFTELYQFPKESLDLSEVYIDKFEINETLKMKENEYYFIDHPYFGIILKISLWHQ